MRLTRALMHYRLDGDNDEHFRALEQAPHTGLPWPVSDKLKRVVDTMVETGEKYEVGEVDGDTAAERLMSMIQASDIMPHPFGWKNPRSATSSPRRGRWPTSWAGRRPRRRRRSRNLAATPCGLAASAVRPKKLL